MEKTGNKTDEIANKALPHVKSPIFMKGCKAIKRIDTNSIISDKNGQAHGSLKNWVLYLII